MADPGGQIRLLEPSGTEAGSDQQILRDLKWRPVLVHCAARPL
jgi:hypothetical protein